MNNFLEKHFPTVISYKLHKNERGIVFFTVLFTGLLLTFIGLSMADVALVQYRRTSDNVYVSNALLTAEAGIEQSLTAINAVDNFAGFAETNFYENDDQGRGTYETAVTAGTGPNERVITSTGRAYDRVGNLSKERRVRVTIVGTSSPGYSVQSGAGGLILNNGYIANSRVHVTGKITLANSSSAGIGTSANPLDVFVNNIACPTTTPPGPTYPSQCTSGQPITTPNWSSGRIYGNVCATGQTQSRWPDPAGPQQIIGGNGGTGLQVGCVAPSAPMPTYDRSAHIASMTTTQSPTATPYNCTQWMSGAPADGFGRTFPPNIRLNGNATWSSSCDLTITGNVYITGNLTMDGNSTIRIANSLGTTRPIIVVDGQINAGSGSSKILPNASGTGAHFISYKSTAACNPGCTTVTGNDLKNSSNQTYVRVAGRNNFPGTIFHAYWSKILLDGSGSMGSAIGQTIQLDGGSTIVFGLDLASGESTWTIRSYQYDYD